MALLPPLPSLSSLLFLLGVTGFFARGMAEEQASWREGMWNGERAWTSVSAGWVATVSEERSRLVSLAPEGGGNILFVDTKEAISWGGHRLWLGPQTKWFSDWPPPADWESSRCARVTALGNRLELTHAHSDKRYPQVTRAYFWSGGVLHCEARWQGEQYYAIQILQLPRGSVTHVRRAISKELPKGYMLAAIYGRKASIDGDIASGVARIDGNRLTLWHANVSDKIAVPSQEITAEIGECRLSMRPGRSSGISSKAPDLGMLTQVYLGDWENPFIELEQLSGYGGAAMSTFEILIEPKRLKQGAFTQTPSDSQNKHTNP